MFHFSRRSRNTRSSCRGTLNRPAGFTNLGRAHELLEPRRLFAIAPALAGSIGTLEPGTESAAPREVHTGFAGARPIASSTGFATAPNSHSQQASVFAADQSASIGEAFLSRPYANPLNSGDSLFSAAATAVSLPFADNFNLPDNSKLSSAWVERVGDLRIQGGRLALNTNGTAIVTLNGP